MKKDTYKKAEFKEDKNKQLTVIRKTAGKN
jgi:hypothetical protein